MHRPLLILIAVFTAIGLVTQLSACTSTGPAITTPPTTVPATGSDITAAAPPPAPPADHTRENHWQLASGQLVIHVGKTGRLARLGHNHLVSTTKLTGSAWITAASTLRAEVQTLVTDLSVDDPALRATYRTATDPKQSIWADTYRSVPSRKNIADTRANMLGSRVLDAKNHPYLQVRLSAPDAAAEFASSSAGSISATLEIMVREIPSQLPITLQWQRSSAGHIAWQTEFRLYHSALGLTPFSALGGALAVADEMTVEVSGVLERSGTVQTGVTTVEHQSDN